MTVFTPYLETIENPEHQSRTQSVLNWVAQKFPQLEPRIAWNQPMFTDHGTFIIGFSASKLHLAVAPERAGILRFSEEIQKAGFTHTQMLIRFPWKKPVDYALLEKIISYNLFEKSDCTTFWRKS